MNDFFIKFSNFNTKIFVGQKICAQIGQIVKQKLLFESLCNVVIITDNVVYNLFGKLVKQSFLNAGFKVLMFKIGSGEKSKNLNNFKKVCNFLIDHRIKRTDFIVSLGGGVVCDFAGFVSACFLRGVRFIQIPTTLLAMVDACVGGKTALNLKQGKNLIGFFKQPDLVLCNLSFVETLPAVLISSAMAEIIKYSVLFSESFFNFLLDCKLKLLIGELEKIVVKCLTFKKKLIEIDEFDEKNERIKLNFGHTIGHALETYFGYDNTKLNHGQAVALGMSFCTRQGEKLGLTKVGSFERLKLVLEKFNLPTSFKFNLKKLYAICLNDKKIFSNGLNLVLIKEIGCCFVKKFSLAEFKNFLEI